MKALLLMLLLAGAAMAEEEPCVCDACREKRGEKVE
jgi:hypothetical protein